MNDNTLPEEELKAAFAMFDWVRPVATAMRAQSIPEEVVQSVMLYLLLQLTDHFEKAN